MVSDSRAGTLKMPYQPTLQMFFVVLKVVSRRHVVHPSSCSLHLLHSGASSGHHFGVASSSGHRSSGGMSGGFLWPAWCKDVRALCGKLGSCQVRCVASTLARLVRFWCVATWVHVKLAWFCFCFVGLVFFFVLFFFFSFVRLFVINYYHLNEIQAHACFSKI
jgi:hypothetical protein